MWEPRRLNKRWRDEVAKIHLELPFRKQRTDEAMDTLNILKQGQLEARRGRHKTSKMCRAPKKVTWCDQWEPSLRIVDLKYYDFA